MKYIFIVNLITLLASSSYADVTFFCGDQTQSAQFLLSNESRFREIIYEECNGGVGDEFTNCHDVISFLEDKSAIVKLDAETLEIPIIVSRSKGTNELFRGNSEVMNNNELLQIYIENEDSLYSISVRYLDLAGKFLRRIHLPCNMSPYKSSSNEILSSSEFDLLQNSRSRP